MTNFMRDSAPKGWLLESVPLELAVIGWCVVYTLAIAAIDWLIQ